MAETGPGPPTRKDESERLRSIREKIDEKNRRLRKLRERVEERDRELGELRARLSENDRGGGGPVRAERVAWIFCTGRSGSTWLASMLGDLGQNEMWDEPLVGALFGEFYERRVGHKRGAKFILGPRHKETWLGSIRSTVLEGASARYPGLDEGDGYLVVKEPHGSVGAPLLVEALPESRVVFLVRDPRDVMASALDAHREGSWISQGRGGKRPRKPDEGRDPDTFKQSDSDPDSFVLEKTANNLRHVEKAREAYRAHSGPKTLVRYEDLRSDTSSVMRRLCAELGMDVDEAELERVVKQHAFESLPEEKRGEGKFYRKASPGGWREDLTEGQARMVEEAAAPLLDEFYPGWRQDGSYGG